MIQVQRLYADAKLPTRAPGAVGYDLYAHSIVPTGDGRICVGFGVAVMPDTNCWLALVPRSSIGRYGLTLSNGMGVIDPDYRGELKGVFYAPHIPALFEAAKKGDRLCQLIVMALAGTGMREVDSLPETARGAGGFGSTGR